MHALIHTEEGNAMERECAVMAQRHRALRDTDGAEHQAADAHEVAIP